MVDYTEMLETPAATADHLMLEHDERERREIEWQVENHKGVMVCELKMEQE